MDWTALYPGSVRLPNLHPRTIGGKIAISCHKDRDFLIRAWAPSYTGSNRLVDWVLHHIGRLNLSEVEWFGYTYSGQPSYMRDHKEAYTSGLTIQYFVEPKDSFAKKLLDEGTFGPGYGPPKDLEIPGNGHIQKVHNDWTV